MENDTLFLIARDSATHVTLTHAESIGLFFDTMAGMLSTTAAAVILVLILVRPGS